MIKLPKLKPNEIIITTEKCSITGINNNPIQTLGSTIANFQLPDNSSLNHVFQVVEENFPIPTDGILGRDFLSQYQCIINYDTWTLSCLNKGQLVELVIEDNLRGDIILPPRCEAFRQVSLILDEGDYLFPSTEIRPGIFGANTIVNSTNSVVKFINTTDKVVKLNKNFSNHCVPLNNYNIFSFSENSSVHLNNYNVFNFSKNPTNNRKQQLSEEINLSHVETNVKNRLMKLCDKYSNLFALKTDTLTCNNFYKQQIHLNDPAPVYIKNYRTPEAHIGEINSQIDKMLNDGIIQPSISPYNSPILLVPKKSESGDKKWRLVVDFRQLNKKIIADKFPLPRVDEILDHLGRAKYFSTLDLASGFHQIELEEDSKKFTAFSTASGHFEFNRLPFGLNISPNSFQRMMTIALSGLPPQCAFLYIDDIIVVGCSINHHLMNLENVFEHLAKYNLKLNPSKCHFFCADVTYLGHHISRLGIQPDKSKYNAISNFPVPKNADDVRRFVAFCNYYRRFIPYFSDLASPLNALLKKNVKFVWTDACQHAFESMKMKLLSPQILKFPDFSKPFILSTDASKLACGAVLSQVDDNIEMPIAYASKAFSKCETNKSTIEQELIAIHWAITHFRPYLYGRRFTVKTDHRPLVYLFSMKDPSSKLTHMRLDLEEFCFDIEYVKGKNNVGPDALSRIILDSEDLQSLSILPVQTRSATKKQNNQRNETIIPDSCNTETDHLSIYESVNNLDAFNIPKIMFDIRHNKINLQIFTKNLKRVIAHAALFCTNGQIELTNCLQVMNELAKKSNIKMLAMKRDDKIFTLIPLAVFKQACNEILKDIKIVIYVPVQVVKDNDMIQKLISENHDSPTGGHVGTNRLLKRLRSKYYWPNMKNSINSYIKNCFKCIQNKHTYKTNEIFTKTTTPTKCFDTISIDTIGPFTRSSKGNRYALTIQCDLSKFIIVTPIPDKQAKTLAKALVESCLLIFGCPSVIKSDLGTEYKNEIFDNICHLLEIQQKFSTSYHPQTIGSLERNHRCLNEYLRHFINEQHDDWDSWLIFYSFSYNTTPHSEHLFTPFELIFGKQANLPSQFINNVEIEPLYNYESYLAELKFKLQTVCQKASQLLDKSKLKRIKSQQQKANPLRICNNNKVWLRKENRRKLDPVYSGPYEILSEEHPNIIIKNLLTEEILKVHKNRLIVA